MAIESHRAAPTASPYPTTSFAEATLPPLDDDALPQVQTTEPEVAHLPRRRHRNARFADPDGQFPRQTLMSTNQAFIKAYRHDAAAARAAPRADEARSASHARATVRASAASAAAWQSTVEIAAANYSVPMTSIVASPATPASLARHRRRQFVFACATFADPPRPHRRPSSASGRCPPSRRAASRPAAAAPAAGDLHSRDDDQRLPLAAGLPLAVGSIRRRVRTHRRPDRSLARQSNRPAAASSASLAPRRRRRDDHRSLPRGGARRPQAVGDPGRRQLSRTATGRPARRPTHHLLARRARTRASPSPKP